MKLNFNPKLIIPVLIFMVSATGALHAAERTSRQVESPWNLSVDLGILAMISNSTLDTNGEKEISDNTKKGSAPHSIWTFPLFNLRYQHKPTQTHLFLGTPIDGSNLALALGVVQPVPEVGIFTFSVAPGFGSTLWENPYEQGVDRKETEVDIFTTSLKVNHVAFTPLNIDYSKRTVDVHHDEIGALFADLERDGEIHSLKLTYDAPLSKSSLVSPGITLEKGDFEGDSESYQQTGFMLSYKRKGQGKMVMLQAMVSQSLFQREHPLYGKTRKDLSAGASALLRIQDLFKVSDLYSNIIAGTGIVDSNIDFLDVDSFYAALTVGYAFR